MSKDIVKREENSLSTEVNGGVGIEGFDGFSMQDLPMPFVKLVHPTSTNVSLPSGGNAKPGSWYHTGKKEAKDSMAMVILFAKHVKIEDFNDPEVINDGVKILALDLEDLESPFAMTLTKGGWFAFTRLMAAFKSWKISKPWTRAVVLGSVEKTTKDKKTGREMKFLVPTLELSEALTKEDLAIVEEFRLKFKDRTDFQEDEEGHTASDFSQDENINLDDIDLDGSLGLEDLDSAKPSK